MMLRLAWTWFGPVDSQRIVPQPSPGPLDPPATVLMIDIAQLLRRELRKGDNVLR